MIELKYRLTWKTSWSRKLDTERASNYSLASFLWYLNNRVYILLDWRSQNSLEDTDDGYLIREQKIKEIKSIFMNRITHIISNALKARERKWYPDVTIDDVKKYLRKIWCIYYNYFFDIYETLKKIRIFELTINKNNMLIDYEFTILKKILGLWRWIVKKLYSHLF